MTTIGVVFEPMDAATRPREVDSVAPLPSEYIPLASLAIATIVGVATSQLLSIATPALLTLAGVFLFAWLVSFLARAEIVGWMFLLLCVMACAACWASEAWRYFPVNDLGLRSTTELYPIVFEAVARETPRIREPRITTALQRGSREATTRLEVAIVRVRDSGEWAPCAGTARMFVTGKLTDLRAGDRFVAIAKHSTPTAPMNEGDVDFARYERSRRRLSRIVVEQPECVRVVDRGRLPWLQVFVLAMRSQVESLCLRQVSDESAGLAAAMLIGSRDLVDPEQSDLFLVTGTIHLLAISGLNVGVFVSLFWLLDRLSLLGPRTVFLGTCLGAVLYAVLVGGEAPVVRASVLVCVMAFAIGVQRNSNSWNALSAAVLVISIFQPLAILEVGTQLSFLSVGTLIYFARRSPELVEPLDRLIAETRPWHVRFFRWIAQEIRSVLWINLVIWIVTTPLVWLHFHIVSPISILLNLPAILFSHVVMWSGIATIAAGSINETLAAPFSQSLSRSIDLAMWSLARSASIYGSHAWLPSPPWWWVSVFYVAIVLFAILPALRPRRFTLLSLVVVWFAISLWLPNLSRTDKLRVSFLSVGHGLSVLVEAPNGKTVLYDCGSLSPPRSNARAISGALWARGISRIDAVILSHADVDHFNTLPEILKRFSVGTVYVSPVMLESRSPALLETVRAIESHKVPIREIRAGDRLSVDPQMRVETLHPTRRGILGTDNENSLVILLEHKNQRILLTGDLEQRGLSQLLDEEPIAVDVLLAPHHGSVRENPRAILEWANPKHVVISGRISLESRIQHTEAIRAYTQTRARVWHTSLEGQVTFELVDNQFFAHSFR